MKKVLLAAIAALMLLPACTRVETGHAGVRVTWTGEVEPNERGLLAIQTLSPLRATAERSK